MSPVQKTFTIEETIYSRLLTVMFPWGYVSECDYPLSYTAQECLDEWCCDQGYNLLSLRFNHRRYVRGTFLHNV